jgi:hypothetical protein
VLAVGLRFGTGVLDDAVSMIPRRIQSIELEWNAAGIDDTMLRPCRNEYCEARSDGSSNAPENRLTVTLLHSNELVELVHFRAAIFSGL